MHVTHIECDYYNRIRVVPRNIYFVPSNRRRSFFMVRPGRIQEVKDERETAKHYNRSLGED